MSTYKIDEDGKHFNFFSFYSCLRRLERNEYRLRTDYYRRPLYIDIENRYFLCDIFIDRQTDIYKKMHTFNIHNSHHNKQKKTSLVLQQNFQHIFSMWLMLCRSARIRDFGKFCHVYVTFVSFKTRITRQVINLIKIQNMIFHPPRFSIDVREYLNKHFQIWFGDRRRE